MGIGIKKQSFLQFLIYFIFQVDFVDIGFVCKMKSRLPLSWLRFLQRCPIPVKSMLSCLIFLTFLSIAGFFFRADIQPHQFPLKAFQYLSILYKREGFNETLRFENYTSGMSSNVPWNLEDIKKNKSMHICPLISPYLSKFCFRFLIHSIKS